MPAVCSTPSRLMFVVLAAQVYFGVPHQSTNNFTKSYTYRGGGVESGRVHQFKFKERVAIVIVVINKANNTDRRHWLRTQMKRSLMLLELQAPKWPERYRVVFRFVIGTAWLSEELFLALVAEHESHGDILFLDVPDSDRPDPPLASQESATTLKMLHSATWAYEHWHFDHFARIGDAAYFRVDHFLQNIAPTLPEGPLMYGYCSGLSFETARDFPDVAEVSLPYCSSMGFVMSYDAIEYVARSAHFLNNGYPDDAIVGSWFVGTRLQMIHDKWRFHDWQWYVCSNESVLVHELRSADRWAQIDGQGIIAACSPQARPPILVVATTSD